MELEKGLHFVDVDGTIIHHRGAEDGEIDYEFSRGKVIGCIRKDVLELLKARPENLVIVTGRAYAQCLRVPEIFNIHYVLCNNGAVLVENGHIDYDWMQESYVRAERVRKHLDRAYRIMNRFNGEVLNYSYGMNIVYKGERAEEVCRQLGTDKELCESLMSYTDLRVIELDPPDLTKEVNCKRFVERVMQGKQIKTYGYGDTIKDYHMGEIDYIATEDYRVDIELVKNFGFWREG